jgi:hypothetical protein
MRYSTGNGSKRSYLHERWMSQKAHTKGSRFGTSVGGHQQPLSNVPQCASRPGRLLDFTGTHVYCGCNKNQNNSIEASSISITRKRSGPLSCDLSVSFTVGTSIFGVPRMTGACWTSADYRTGVMRTTVQCKPWLQKENVVDSGLSSKAS